MSDIKYVDLEGLSHYHTKEVLENDNKYVAKEAGKGLMTDAERTKLASVENGAEENVIEGVVVNGTTATITGKVASVNIEAGKIDTISVNGEAQVIDKDKNVNIIVPTKTSDLTNDDNVVKDASYVHTDNNYTTTEKNKLAGIATGANKTVVDDALSETSANPVQNKVINTALGNKVDKVTGKGLSTNDYTTTEKDKLAGIAAGAEVNKIDSIKVNGTAQTITNKVVDITIPAAAEYSVVETTTTSGYAKTYSLTKDGTEIGAKINIPKDLVVESGEVKTVTVADVPYVGAKVGDKYIDLTLNDSGANHIYIPVKDLVDVYTAGNGINVSNANVISAVVDSTNANGLDLTSSGLKLSLATTSKAGAMSSADKTKLDAFSSASNYVKTADLVAITNAEIDTIFE